MKRTTLFLALTFVLFLSCAGLGAQMTQTNYQVNLTWTAPSAVTGGWAGCTTTAPCSYSVWRTTLAAGATACPTAAASYAEVSNPASLPTAASYADTTVAANSNYCYTVQTVQEGASSPPSNSVELSVPALPVSAATPAATTTVTTITVTTVP